MRRNGNLQRWMKKGTFDKRLGGTGKGRITGFKRKFVEEEEDDIESKNGRLKYNNGKGGNLNIINNNLGDGANKNMTLTYFDEWKNHLKFKHGN